MSEAALNPYAVRPAAGTAGIGRWLLSALAIVLAHAALIGAGLAWYAQSPPPGVAVPAITIDLAPATASPEVSQQDLAPGPDMQEAEQPAAPAPPPPPPPPVPQEQIPAAPPQADPQVAAPREDKPVRHEARPETTAEPKPEPEPVKPKPHKKEVRAPSKRPQAPRTTSAPRADRRAARAAAARAGAVAAAVLPAYRDRLAAHLQRFKRYPAAARAAGEQGTALLSFTVSRGGRVLSSRLARSSGHRTLDAETMAMIRRAQPLPAFPPEVTQGSMSFTVPVRFAIH
ncbi:MAG: energy transducer TonB [Xanthobacteraceae bacterium]|nr:energy transducer TonB [Xanthobacteraceae bacterium]